MAWAPQGSPRNYATDTRRCTAKQVAVPNKKVSERSSQAPDRVKRRSPRGRAVEGPPAERPRWGTRLVIGVLLGVALYVTLGVLADLRALRAALSEFHAASLVWALALVLSAYVLRALRWRLYLHRVGVLEPAGREALGFAAGFAMGMANGKGGQVVKAYYLQLATGLPYSVSIPAALAERMADLASVVLLLLVGLVFSPTIDMRAPVAIVALLAIFTLTLRSEGVVRGALRLGRRIRWLARHEAQFLQGHARLREHMRWRDLAAPALIGLSAYFLEALALQALVVRGFGLAIPLGLCVLMLALADLAGVVSLIPGGLGVAEGSLLVMLRVADVPLATATAVTILFRICTLWLGVALGAAAAATLQWMHRDPARRHKPAQG